MTDIRREFKEGMAVLYRGLTWRVSVFFEHKVSLISPDGVNLVLAFVEDVRHLPIDTTPAPDWLDHLGKDNFRVWARPTRLEAARKRWGITAE